MCLAKTSAFFSHRVDTKLSTRGDPRTKAKILRSTENSNFSCIEISRYLFSVCRRRVRKFSWDSRMCDCEQNSHRLRAQRVINRPGLKYLLPKHINNYEITTRKKKPKKKKITFRHRFKRRPAVRTHVNRNVYIACVFVQVCKCGRACVYVCASRRR